MAVITWLHLSDWHQSGKDFNRQVVREKLIEDIRRCRREFSPLSDLDFVFFTGDLAYHGTKAEYETAKTTFLEPVLEAAGVKDRLFLIPGNHDLDRNNFDLLPSALQSPFNSEDTVQKWQSEEKYRKALCGPFDAYQEFIDAYAPAGFGSYGASRIISVKGIEVGILGCNSALMCARNKVGDRVDDYGQLIVGEQQIHAGLQRISTESMLRIALIHHPFEWLSEFDRTQIENDLRKKCQFILRGHVHQQQVNVDGGTRGTSVIVPGGASYDRRHATDTRYVNAYNYVVYDTDTGEGTVYLRCWVDRKTEWAADYHESDGDQFPFQSGESGAAGSPKNPERGTDRTTQTQAANLARSRDTYLQYVAKRWAKLELRGILQMAKSDPISLEEVYVSLTAESEETARPEIRRRRGQDEEPIPEEIEDSRIMTEDGDKERLPFGKTVERSVPVELPQALRERRHLVILGDPGAGKTTLSRFLAHRFALDSLNNQPQVRVPVYSLPTAEQPEPEIIHTDDYGDTCLPILLRVADYAEELRKDSNLRLREFLSHARSEADISAAEATVLFEDVLKQGKALVILDGLDEVTQSSDRATIARRIDDFVHGIGTSNRLVVTSRVAGYMAARLNAGFHVLTIKDMALPQIERFVNRRMAAYERLQTPDGTARSIYTRAEKDIQAILHGVQHNEGVKRLAVNPLLLTILCLIHRTGARLPERRVELYEMASKTLLEDWRPAQTEKADCGMRLTEADRLLAPLADWMHEHTDRGLIAESKALQKLHEFCAARHGLTENHPTVQDEVESFWRRLTYDTSVFVERSPGEYAFLHLTFQEYWAARYLVRDFKQAPAQLRARRHDPRFAEVVLLAIASRSEEDAAHLIRSAIWCPEAESEQYSYIAAPLEPILRRDFLLAARCLADCTGIEPTLGRAISSELVTVVLNISPTRFPPLIDNAREAIEALRHTEIGKRATAMLLRMCSDENNNVRRAVARALGTAGQGLTEAIRALIKMSNDENNNVRRAVARALGTAGKGTAETIQILIGMCKDKDSNVRRVVPDALGTAGQGSTEAIQALIGMIRDKDSNVRTSVAIALGTAGQGSTEIIHISVRLCSDKDSNVRKAVAEVLGTVGQGSTEVIQMLIGMCNDEDSGVRSAVARALGTAGQGSTEVIAALIAMIRDRHSSVRTSIARALGTAGQGSTEAIRALIGMCSDENNNVRLTSWNALWKIAPVA